MKTLFILNGPPYGTEHSYNGLRLAGALAKRDGEHVRIFLMGDAVGCALQGQVLPEGYYHLDRMLGSAIRRGADVGCDAITMPGGTFVPGSPARPSCVIMNYGLTAQSNIPVGCWIDSAGTHVYNLTTTYADALLAATPALPSSVA